MGRGGRRSKPLIQRGSAEIRQAETLVLDDMIAHDKQRVQIIIEMESAVSTRNRPDPTRVLVSHRTFPFGWAFRPALGAYL